MSQIVRYVRADARLVGATSTASATAAPAADRRSRRGGPDERASRSRRPDRDLLTAWLLLLLGRRATHGYCLRRQLVAQGLDPDPAALYRVLRRLEADGCVASRWTEPAGGPRRRLYQLMPKGRGELREMVGVIAVVREVNDAFLCAHDSWGPDVMRDE